MEGLPAEYVIQNLYTHCKRPLYKKYQGVYNAECCVCNEGNSSGRKRRLFYFPSDHYFYCFNCNKSWSELSWLKEVTRKPYFKILEEANNYRTQFTTTTTAVSTKVEKVTEVRSIPIIPEDSIDILDTVQCEFYKDTDKYDLIEKALKYCRLRKITDAINRPKSLYVTTTDFIHKNRLIIPFYSAANKIESYQSRVLFGDEYPKYLTKFGEKCMYGENSIESDIPYIFVFEGPIDAMFVKNGVAIGGASLTERQEQFLNSCFGHEIIFVYDNDRDNKQMQKKIKTLAKQNKKLFIWPPEFRKYKDINEICCNLNLHEFPYKFIVNNAYKGIEALMKT